MADLMARMAEIAVSRHEADVLVALGLGSCIGLALLDRVVAGLRARARRAAGVARGRHGAWEVRRHCRPRAARAR